MVMLPDGNQARQLWVTVPPGENLDEVAARFGRETGEISVVNDRNERWLCIAPPTHRVAEVRRILAGLGYISQEK